MFWKKGTGWRSKNKSCGGTCLLKKLNMLKKLKSSHWLICYNVLESIWKIKYVGISTVKGGKNYKCLGWNLKFWELVSFPPVDNVVSCEHSDDCKNKISTSSFNQSPDKTSEG